MLFILTFAKLLTSILKFTGKGDGTALPGLIIGKYFPGTTAKLMSQIPNVVVVTGTNGKTTTQTILNSILKTANTKVMTNTAGANLSRGILSQLLKEATITGKIDKTHAILEVEEATFPKIVNDIKPNIIAVTNLYRDQLDAYGEVDITEKYIRSAIEQCPNAKVVLNGDDPRVSELTRDLENETFYVSLPKNYSKNLPYEGITDDNKQSEVNIIKAENIEVNDDLTTNFDVIGRIDNSKLTPTNYQLIAPGYFHIYNALTAISISTLLGISRENITKGIENFKPAFGRGELITKKEGDKQVHFRLLLIKNPAGFSLNLDLIKNIKNIKLLILINDNTADGKDVSWLWDSELEILDKSDLKWIVCGGRRAADMKLRLKYALDGKEILNYIPATQDIKTSIEESFNKAENEDTIFVLPTYTAMLEFRKIMGKKLE